MILYIDNTIGEEILHRKLTEAEMYFFSRIADNHRRGKCKICGEINSLQALCECIGDPHKGVYRSIVGRYAEQSAALSSVNTVFFLTCGESDIEKFVPACIKDNHEIERRYISLENAIDWDGCSALVAENNDDCEFYKGISKWYCSQNQLHGVDISLIQEPGGGSTTPAMLELSVTGHKAPTLCIVDSDQKWGSSREFPQTPARGETCNAVFSVSDQLSRDDKNLPHHVLLVDVHEAENLIPLSVLATMEKESTSISAGISKLKQLAGIDDGYPARHYDMKQGFRYMDHDPQIAYWKYIHVERLGGSEEDLPPRRMNKEETFLICRAFPPISLNHLLKRATKYISEHIKDIEVDEHLLKYWNEIGKTVLTWGYADNPHSA